MRNQKKIEALFIGLLLLLNGCTSAPSIHDAVKALQPMPVGAGAEKIRGTILSIYPESAKRDWVFVQVPRQMTKDMIESEKKFMADWNRLNLFTYVYPPDLFEKLPTQVFVDGTTYFKEGRFEQLSTLEIYFDGNTNYIGFTAATDERVHRQ